LAVGKADGGLLIDFVWKRGTLEDAIPREIKLGAGKSIKYRYAYRIENIVSNPNVFVERLADIRLGNNGRDADNTIAELIDRRKTSVGKYVA
jgi:hypothetical protein